jgi:protein-tyrosine phosphatase
MATDPRHVHWDACLNVRDLGGFPTRDGHTTRSHAVVRADNLCRLTAHGRAALTRYGIRTAIFCRDPREHPLEHDPFTRDELRDVGRVDPDGAVVMYCHAGKERTGIAAALLLELAGVDRATIGREHALSDEHLAPLYAAWREAELDPEARQRLTHALRPDPEQRPLTLTRSTSSTATRALSA